MYKRQPSDDFLRGLRQTTTDSGTLLILDEIQSGMGRSGSFFAHQPSGIRPDIITMAKGIANGFPMGAVLIAPTIEARKGMLGTTFGGNHLACAAAIATLSVIADENLVANAARTGEYLLSALREMDGLTDVRGRGLMIGIDLADGAAKRRDLLFRHHIFTGGAGPDTIRLLPALCLTRDDADRFLNSFKILLDE